MESTSEEVDDVRDLTDICVSFSFSFSSSSEELCSRLLCVSKGETVLYFRGWLRSFDIIRASAADVRLHGCSQSACSDGRLDQLRSWVVF